MIQILILFIIMFFATFLSFTLAFPVFGQLSPDFWSDCNKTCDCSDFYYDNSIMNRTIVTDFDLVCSNGWINSVLTGNFKHRSNFEEFNFLIFNFEIIILKN